MGRKKRNAVYRYVELLEDGKAKCSVGSCDKLLKTQHGANLVNHMKVAHKKEYEEIKTLNDSRTRVERPENLNVSAKVMKECTDLVAVHGLPFQAINYTALQNIIQLIPNNQATANAQTVRESVQENARELRHHVAKELRDKMIALKVDIASLSTRSFMGINLQYSVNDAIVLKNLGVVEIFQRHTSENLKDILKLTLLRFQIKTEQIYSITTDNGANMLKMSRIVAEEVSSAQQSANGAININTDQDEIDQDEDVNFEDENENGSLDLVQEELSLRVQDVLQNYFDEEEENQPITKFKLSVVRCAAHTLQLAMKNACSELNVERTISRGRNLVKKLRNQNGAIIVRQHNKLVPKLDCSTRWHSSVDMIDSLLKLKDICTEDEGLFLPENIWDELEEFVKAMTPGKELTKILQHEQLTPGDFYLSWMRCHFQLRAINSPLSNMVSIKMQERENLLFANDAFINGIILDPRVNSILTPQQRNLAKENLHKIYFAIVELQSTPNPNRNPTSLTPTTPNCSSVAQSIAQGSNPERRVCSELEDFLNNRYMESHDNIFTLLRRDDPRNAYVNMLNQSLDGFFEEPFVSQDVNVLNWWKKKQHLYPLLYKLANVVLASPMTQVSVERLFSSLKFVVSNKRHSLKNDIIEDILLVRTEKLQTVSNLN